MGNRPTYRIHSGDKYAFSHPQVIAADSLSNVWIANLKGDSVTKIPFGDPDGPVIYPGPEYIFDRWLSGVLDSAGNTWEADRYRNEIVRISADHPPRPNHLLGDRIWLRSATGHRHGPPEKYLGRPAAATTAS